MPYKSMNNNLNFSSFENIIHLSFPLPKIYNVHFLFFSLNFYTFESKFINTY